MPRDPNEGTFEVFLGTRYPRPGGEHTSDIEEVPAHGPVDVAAGLAGRFWWHSDQADALDAVAVALVKTTGLVPDRPVQLAADTAVNGLLDATVEAARAGARLGFALAQTLDQSHGAWSRWQRAALEWLANVGCDPAQHGEHMHFGYVRDTADLEAAIRESSAGRKSQPSGAATPSSAATSAVQVIAGAVEKAIIDHEQRLEHGLSAETLTRIGQAAEHTAEDVARAEMTIHVRKHHADPSAPTQDPATPKAQPTAKPRPRRHGSGASRASGSQRAHHVDHGLPDAFEDMFGADGDHHHSSADGEGRSSAA